MVIQGVSRVVVVVGVFLCFEGFEGFASWDFQWGFVVEVVLTGVLWLGWFLWLRGFLKGFLWCLIGGFRVFTGVFLVILIIVIIIIIIIIMINFN